MKKMILAIGVIALFVGMAVIPLSTAEETSAYKPKDSEFAISPVVYLEGAVYQPSGRLFKLSGRATLLLTVKNLKGEVLPVPAGNLFDTTFFINIVKPTPLSSDNDDVVKYVGIGFWFRYYL